MTKEIFGRNLPFMGVNFLPFSTVISLINITVKNIPS